MPYTLQGLSICREGDDSPIHSGLHASSDPSFPQLTEGRRELVILRFPFAYSAELRNKIYTSAAAGSSQLKVRAS
jgi:hypothetical protein